ncbi:hypothetical protein [Rhodococcus sp. LB1]|uniref:hypothetical protein n=1 Tax=Rhodococcus sp. LB1 TaxID=1807499 RepID=UPI00077AAFEB|nr:hypothetical protein [Rhodococcus sp. LB1]KXX59427.1 hypothetical protein AZG88_41295 [Rhodococcus sp. LB1]
MTQSDEVYESSDRTLNDGETEELIAQAERTRTAALAQGRPDLAAKAQEVIDNLTSAHERLEQTHAEHGHARHQLQAARGELDEAQNEEG